jgi:hypothetical protein
VTADHTDAIDDPWDLALVEGAIGRPEDLVI